MSIEVTITRGPRNDSLEMRGALVFPVRLDTHTYTHTMNRLTVAIALSNLAYLPTTWDLLRHGWSRLSDFCGLESTRENCRGTVVTSF